MITRPATISVLICTYKRPDALLPCLAGLAAQTRLPDDVILVVRPSDVVTHEAMGARVPDGLPWRIVAVHEPGLVAARNAGLAAQRCDVVAFCDDDTVASAGWLERLLAHFDDPEVGGVGGRDRCHDGTGFDDRQRNVVGHLQWWGRAIGNHHLGFGAARRVDFLKGANMSFRAEAVRGRWFDTRLRGKGAQADDDLSFSLSVARAGWTLIYDPAALVDHYAASDQLRSYVVQSGLPDPLSYQETCFNHALTLWEQMGLARRAVFVAWASLVGVGNYPGFLQAVRFWLRRDPAAWRKFRINQAAHREVFCAGLAARPALSVPMLKRPRAG
jgi:GT2 family glycosyltransferase